jgi:hypothetical protein
MKDQKNNNQSSQSAASGNDAAASAQRIKSCTAQAGSSCVSRTLSFT